MPALPLHEAGPYVAGAYVVFAVVLMTYVTIMMRHIDRVRRELQALRRDLGESLRGFAGSVGPEGQTPAPRARR